MKIMLHWGSHLPVLMKVIALTDGPVLEMGTGLFSTPYLHWACYLSHRSLVSYENSLEYYDTNKCYQHDDFHDVRYVEDWDAADIERPWDVALIDHRPSERRIVDVARLAQWVKYLVLHDTGPKKDRHYHYSQVFPLFASRYDFNDVQRAKVTVVSNLVDLGRFSL